jgi:glutathione synthase/RimK-type ligase-like ATP-grasp enzyme
MSDTLFVLYQNSGVYSGRALRKMLAGMHSGNVIGGYPKRFAGILRKSTPDHVINLGTTGEISFSGSVVNPREMVRAASNKKQARIAFQEADVPAPKLYLRGSDVAKADLPVIGRTSYHSKGKGFWFCKSLDEVRRAVERGATHFLEFVPKAREYRVHAFCKKKAFGKEGRGSDDYASVKLVEKVWQGKDKPDPQKVQKNHEFGWVFLGQQDRREEELDVVRFAAKQAIAALGLDFGAVDVMFRIKDKRPYVLEVNSTPSLADETADTCEVYAKRILSMLGSKTEKK